MSVVDRTKLNDLIPNLEVGQVANPELRQAVFEEIYNLLELRAAELDVLIKTNTTAYTPTQPYNPATKGYIDNAILGVVAGNLPLGSVDTQYLTDRAVTFAKLSADRQTASIGGQMYAYKSMGGF